MIPHTGIYDMPSELYFQSQIVSTVNKQMGGYAHKLTNAYISGIPDLLIQLPQTPTVLVEIKQQLLLPGTKLVNVELTPLQKIKLGGFIKAGGSGGWAMIAHKKDGSKHIFASNNLDKLKYSIEEYMEDCFHMARSESWTTATAYITQKLRVPEGWL